MVHVFILLLLPLVSPLHLSPTEYPPTPPRNVPLLEIWDCGPQAMPILSNLAESTLHNCHSLKDDVNMCCKNHDFCYEMHKENNFTHDFCDFRFCGCLQDAQDIAQDGQCKNALTLACKLVKGRAGEKIYTSSHPKNAKEIADRYGKFTDARPLGLDMKALVDQCANAKAMPIHCHNAAHHCLVERSWHQEIPALRASEDCRSIMYECLLTIADSNATKPCTSLARRMSAQLNVFNVKLDEKKIGKSVIEVYPIIAARLLAECRNNTGELESCYLEFDRCSGYPGNREASPVWFNAARRIKLACHTNLRACVAKAVGGSEIQFGPMLGAKVEIGTENEEIPESQPNPEEERCWSALAQALMRIRKNGYQDQSTLSLVYEMASDVVSSVDEKRGRFWQWFERTWDDAKEGFWDGVKSAGNGLKSLGKR